MCFDVASFRGASGVTSFRYVEATLLKDISRKIFSGASVELNRHYILLARVFMYILVILYPSFSFMVDLDTVPKAFDHHLQAGWSWTKFCIGRLWYGIFDRAVPILIRRKLKSGTLSRKSTARYLKRWRPKDHFLIGHILQPPLFDIYSSWTF